ncbi:hypothetical protein CLIB1423_09S01618 [[Candida] railenensis]|uniref:Uncharacterized protein n=1 Tax=[Candida] railenensis TaxID=45579 RepID=A0A9P0VXY2_9ASCO|nr:hypothetical protein CLIB1423_09S01618 [[Candida] railenensis]
MNSSNVELQKATVYQSCNDEYKRGVILNREKIAKAFPDIDTDNDWEVISEILQTAKDIQPEYYKSKGTSIPPDEILQKFNPTGIRVPMRSREELSKSRSPLPSSDLLKALHYYTSRKVSKLDKKDRLKLENNFDETALLSLGSLVEDLAERLIGEHGIEIFTERDSSENVDRDEEEPSESEGSEADEDQDDHDDSAGSISDISF